MGYFWSFRKKIHTGFRVEIFDSSWASTENSWKSKLDFNKSKGRILCKFFISQFIKPRGIDIRLETNFDIISFKNIFVFWEFIKTLCPSSEHQITSTQYYCYLSELFWIRGSKWTSNNPLRNERDRIQFLILSWKFRLQLKTPWLAIDQFSNILVGKRW